MGKFKFWHPDSGVIGGIIFGVVIALTFAFIIPPVIRVLILWIASWGL
ncbi:hypothetical protein ABT163_002082 [Escherichia coli]|nr:hypothetical protein [Escherichia coli]HEI3427136.1 hypothetical protein [Escherichia coli]